MTLNNKKKDNSKLIQHNSKSIIRVKIKYEKIKQNTT